MDGSNAGFLVAVFGLGVQELLLILLAVVFLFGAKKIPEIARGLGKGMSEFKKGVGEGQEDTDKKDKDKEKPPPKSTE